MCTGRACAQSRFGTCSHLHMAAYAVLPLCKAASGQLFGSARLQLCTEAAAGEVVRVGQRGRAHAELHTGRPAAGQSRAVPQNPETAAMPFDAAPVVRSPLPDSIAGQSALVLDMVEFYFRDGKRWARGGGRDQR